MRHKWILYLSVLLLGCGILEGKRNKTIMESLSYIDYNSNFKEIPKTKVPQGILDSIKIENQRWNMKRSKISAFENQVTRNKYIFNYNNPNFYQITYCDSIWNVYKRITSLGKLY